MADEWTVRGRLRNEDGASFPEEFRESGQVEGTFATCLLTTDDYKRETCRSLEPVGQLGCCHDKGGHPAFHVAGAPAIQLFPAHFSLEGVDRPRRCPQGHRIDVPRKTQGRFVHGAALSCHHAGPFGSKLIIPEMESGGL